LTFLAIVIMLLSVDVFVRKENSVLVGAWNHIKSKKQNSEEFGKRV